MSVEAFSFHCEHDLDQIETLLASHGTIQWRGGDNDFWGEYLVTRLPDSGIRLRVFRDNDRFVFDISCVPGEAELGAALDLVQTRLLPLLGATDIESHTGWE